MLDEFGIDPAVLILFVGIAAFVVTAGLGACCAFVGMMIAKVLLYIARGDVDRIRL
ncbi:MAG: hypothetical protein KGJ13_07190 [Patescibacteria group bacterium]|nr:hypothetical protein [Patescibacteria group bacterium]